jgi:hypothetical protein
MAIQKKIQLYVSDATGNQKTAKYYRISLPADNLPFDKETNIYKNMMHFYCTISGDSATFGAIGFADSVISLYETVATHKGLFDSESTLINFRNITPTIPEKLLNDGELSFDVHGSVETIHYNSVNGYVHPGYSIFNNPGNEQAKYLEKIVKKSGIFQSSNVIRSNSENDLSSFIPSDWQEFDTMEDLLVDVRKRINDVKTMDRGELYTYEECIAEHDSRFNPGMGKLTNPLGTVNEYKVFDFGDLNQPGDQILQTGCDGHQRILSLVNTHRMQDRDVVIDTTNLTDEIAIVTNNTFDAITNTVHRIQPNTGEVKLNDKFGEYGTSIVFKNKADSVNIKLTVAREISPIEKLATLAADKSSSDYKLAEAFQNTPDSILVETGIAMPPRTVTTDVPINDFYKVINNENIRYLDVNQSSVTIKSTPGTKYKLFAKSHSGVVMGIPVNNTSGVVSIDLNNYTYGSVGSELPDLYLVKYEPTDITVSW